MKNEVLSEIEDKVAHGIKEIAQNSGCMYLNCSLGEWRDCNNYIHELKEMDTKYLERCLRELNNAGRGISLHYESIKKSVDLSGHRFTMEEKSEIISIAKKQLYTLFDLKKQEIQSQLEIR
ncbi:hypothetical protein ACQPUI_08145 [Clostridium butyricum]|jgi:hypothetical protein|uniref:hypothetical protein n=1 Tax=Clostridium TaxID=1485 RepID=UPI0012B73FF5|nr:MULTISPECIES: hypothetical protein [Clostridium]MDU1602509.1 hypothetical protein [Clostridium sp.]MDU4587027.1 hypothetical protein [Clostridium sp.]MZI79392.1 hypothetical protein [Clostridium butyricum]